MWEMYDQLISQMPEQHFITKIFQTAHWTLVENNQKSVGSAMRFSNDHSFDAQRYLGFSLKEAAQLVKSWDFQKASVGLAAINSFFNQMSLIENDFSANQLIEQDTFDDLPTLCKTNNVAMIGHFPYVDRHPFVRERLFIFELEPRKGDYPASAAEFLLPDMDYVFITASSIVNKTLPRLLALSKQATVIVTGASCPMSSILFEKGVDRIGGTVYNQSLQQLIEKKNEKKLHLSNCGTQIQVFRKGKEK